MAASATVLRLYGRLRHRRSLSLELSHHWRQPLLQNPCCKTPAAGADHDDVLLSRAEAAARASGCGASRAKCKSTHRPSRHAPGQCPLPRDRATPLIDKVLRTMRMNAVSRIVLRIVSIAWLFLHHRMRSIRPRASRPLGGAPPAGRPLSTLMVADEKKGLNAPLFTGLKIRGLQSHAAVFGAPRSRPVRV